jgi:hypothetical protein
MEAATNVHGSNCQRRFRYAALEPLRTSVETALGIRFEGTEERLPRVS